MSTMQEDRERKRFVHHSSTMREIPLSQAFSCASCGIRYALSTQRNFKIHLLFSVIAIILGFGLQIPLSSWLAIILCITIVFAMEMMNTALESIVDLASPEWHILAMRAKDCAAAAVYVCAIGSIIVAAVVFVPPLLHLLGLS